MTNRNTNAENGGSLAGPAEWRQTTELLLRRQVILPAMKHGRAPIRVTPNFSNGLLRRGILNDLDERGNVARRFSFLGDGRMLLARLRHGPAKMPADPGTSSAEIERSMIDDRTSRTHSDAHGIA